MVRKLLLVCSSPFKQEVEIDHIIYLKTRNYNRLFYLLKLLLLVLPMVLILLWNVIADDRIHPELYVPVICIVTIILALTLIYFVVPNDILDKLEKKM